MVCKNNRFKLIGVLESILLPCLPDVPSGSFTYICLQWHSLFRSVSVPLLVNGLHCFHAVLLDFGLSGELGSGDRPDGLLETTCGSLAYSAPELIGHHAYGKPVDVWSVYVPPEALCVARDCEAIYPCGTYPSLIDPIFSGVCIYLLVTGHFPFPANQMTQIHAQILDGILEFPDEVCSRVSVR
jgi:serine/threonine protein kinase